MLKSFRYVLASSAIALAVACSTNAITGRKQLALVSEQEVQQMAVSQYRQFLTESRVVPKGGNRDAEMVDRVGRRLVSAINQYYTANGLQQELAGYNWEVNLVQSNDVNAWCMPGGKIVVYTGLLPITQNEPSLAVVMGHEIAHALAKHGSERMSQGLLQQLGGAALSVALANRPQQTQAIFSQAYGLGTTVGLMLPFSRNNELEADRFGLQFSALAGYNPQEAIPFWTRMANLKQNSQQPPEFLSTHPADQTRINRLKAMMPEVLEKYYRPAQR